MTETGFRRAAGALGLGLLLAASAAQADVDGAIRELADQFRAEQAEADAATLQELADAVRAALDAKLAALGKPKLGSAPVAGGQATAPVLDALEDRRPADSPERAATLAAAAAALCGAYPTDLASLPPEVRRELEAGAAELVAGAAGKRAEAFKARIKAWLPKVKDVIRVEIKANPEAGGQRLRDGLAAFRLAILAPRNGP